MPAIHAIHSLRPREWNATLPSKAFSDQLSNPGDIFSVLLLIGGDIIERALAQLVGTGCAPVAFSFGWVAFAIKMVTSAVGGRLLMPNSDVPCIVLNAETGHVRENRSWIIGRLVRDFEAWMDLQPRCASLPSAIGTEASNPADARQSVDIQQQIDGLIDARWRQLKEKAAKHNTPPPQRPPKVGLCISIYRARQASRGCPGYDAPYFTGVITCFVQLGIAAIPCGLYGDWSIILVTAPGIVLALLSGTLVQWSEEKWACREKTQKTFVMTAGNGAQHAIVIQGAGLGFDLEDLAASGSSTGSTTPASWKTQSAVIVIALLWILLLIAATGIKQHSWFLVGLCGFGMLQNIYAAGVSRSPEAFGMPLEFVDVLVAPKVMDVLKEAETKFPRLGRSLLPVFFPGRLSEAEKDLWACFEERASRLEEEAKCRKENGSEAVRI